jgi:cholesterol transport system auxiliary component
MRLRTIIGLAAVGAALGACSFSSIMGGGAPATFDLKAPAIHRVSQKNLQLTVNPPVAIKTIDTEEILVKSGSGRISYFSGVAWADRLPKLFQARLVETFSNSGAFRAVLTNQDRVSGQVSLSTEIRDFQVEVVNGRSEAVIDVFVKLANERENLVVTSRRFQERVPAANEDVGAGITALNEAFQRVAANIVSWSTGRRT